MGWGFQKEENARNKERVRGLKRNECDFISLGGSLLGIVVSSPLTVLSSCQANCCGQDFLGTYGAASGKATSYHALSDSLFSHQGVSRRVHGKVCINWISLHEGPWASPFPCFLQQVAFDLSKHCCPQTPLEYSEDRKQIALPHSASKEKSTI